MKNKNYFEKKELVSDNQLCKEKKLARDNQLCKEKKLARDNQICKEKELVRKVTVVVALDLGCGNTKNSEYESK